MNLSAIYPRLNIKSVTMISFYSDVSVFKANMVDMSSILGKNNSFVFAIVFQINSYQIFSLIIMVLS